MIALPDVTAVLITREAVYPEDAWPAATFGEVLVETGCVGIHRRWALAWAARSPIVYAQDDDCVVDVARLWGHYRGGLTYAITPRLQRGYDRLCRSRACLIGWGAFFPRAMADPRRWTPWAQRYGAIPSHEADRIATWFAEGHTPVVQPLTPIPRARAMSRDNPDHFRSRDRTIRKLQRLGA